MGEGRDLEKKKDTTLAVKRGKKRMKELLR